MFEFEVIVCGMSLGLVKFAVGIWVVIGQVCVWWESGGFGLDEVLSFESLEYF